MCPHCHRFPIEDYIWWVSLEHESKKKRYCNWWCGAWRDPNKVLVFQNGADPSEAKLTVEEIVDESRVASR